jgi:hypothetical protein
MQKATLTLALSMLLSATAFPQAPAGGPQAPAGGPQAPAGGPQAPAGAPQNAAAGRGGRGGPAVVSPQIESDGRVTFRILAPQASAVSVTGDLSQGLVAAPGA